MKRNPFAAMLALVVLLLVPEWTQAQVPGPELGAGAFSAAQLRDLDLVVVQNGGRYKPLDTVARETVRFVTEKRRFHRQDPTVTYLSWVVDGRDWLDTPMVRVGYLPLRRAVGLDPKRTEFSINELRTNTALAELFRKVDDKERADEKLDKMDTETKMVGTKLLVLDETLSGAGLRIVPNPMPNSSQWFTFPEAAQAPFFDTTAIRDALAGVLESFQKRDGTALAAAGGRLRTALAAVAPAAMPAERAIAAEHRYNSMNPFQRAWMLYALAFVILLMGFLSSNRIAAWAGLVPLVLGFAVHVYGMVLRVVVAGRPPVSNIYESMIFVAAAIVLFALIFEAVYRPRIFALTAAGLGVVALILAENLPISAEISPLVPVLRSATWLTFHVLTILLGYSAAFLAGGLAYVGLGAHLFGRGEGAFAVRLDRFHYRIVQLTVLFLGTGIILGGVWANQSWGRYWGWDPKETWALISLLVYLVIIHGRFAGWLKRLGTNVASVIGLNMVIMTYYGVNYFLVGLHSYAGGTAFKVPLWVKLFLVVEVVFVSLAWWRGTRSRRRAQAERLARVALAEGAVVKS